jgi:hypothetical protein
MIIVAQDKSIGPMLLRGETSVTYGVPGDIPLDLTFSQQGLAMQCCLIRLNFIDVSGERANSTCWVE